MADLVLTPLGVLILEAVVESEDEGLARVLADGRVLLDGDDRPMTWDEMRGMAEQQARMIR